MLKVYSKSNEATKMILIATMLIIAALIIAGQIDGMQKQINQLKQPQQIVKVEPVKVDAALVDKIEELARLNERLEIENAAIKAELAAFQPWWDDWASKNSFPGSEVD
jgi:UPF0288 family protein (methanogenesis marker protein 3)